MLVVVDADDERPESRTVGIAYRQFTRRMRVLEWQADQRSEQDGGTQPTGPSIKAPERSHRDPPRYQPGPPWNHAGKAERQECRPDLQKPARRR
ncbi:hypothetical protein [Bradyrhizobium sp. UFLA06-06]